MRYQLPAGVSGVSADGHDFQADEDGIIQVSDLLPAAHAALQNRHLFNLTALPDEAADALVAAPISAEPEGRGAQKKAMVALLRTLGVVLDGRVTLESARVQLLAALTQAEAPGG